MTSDTREGPRNVPAASGPGAAIMAVAPRIPGGAVKRRHRLRGIPRRVAERPVAGMAMAPILARVVLATALVTGCASTGTMTGQLSRPGRAPERVTLSYETDRWDDSGNLSLTLPGGESFTGRYEKVGSVAGAAPAPGLDIDFSTVDWGQAADRWTFGQVGSDSHTIVALLQGNRGRTIRCRFTLLYAAGGMQDGGTGQCEVDTGERIDVRF